MARQCAKKETISAGGASCSAYRSAYGGVAWLCGGDRRQRRSSPASGLPFSQPGALYSALQCNESINLGQHNQWLFGGLAYLHLNVGGCIWRRLSMAARRRSGYRLAAARLMKWLLHRRPPAGYSKRESWPIAMAALISVA